VPWILGLSEMWMSVTFLQDATSVTWATEVVAFLCVVCSGSFHLRHWRRLVSPSNIVTTISALWAAKPPPRNSTRGSRAPSESTRFSICARFFAHVRRHSLGRDQSFIVAFLVLGVLEILCVIPLIILIPWWTKGFIHHMLCSDTRTLSFCVLITVFVFLKTCPWIVGFVIEAMQQSQRRPRWDDVRMKDFLVASPRIGFLLTLMSLTLIIWRQQINGVTSPCCEHSRNTCDLTHLPFFGDGTETLSLFLVGLSAWSVSVFWSLIVLLSFYMRTRLRRLMYCFGLALIVVLSVMGLIELRKFKLEYWRHVEVGVAVWVTASICFHGQELMSTTIRMIGHFVHKLKFGHSSVHLREAGDVPSFQA